VARGGAWATIAAVAVVAGTFVSPGAPTAVAQGDGREFVGTIDDLLGEGATATIVQNEIRFIVSTTGLGGEIHVRIDTTLDFTPIGESENSDPACFTLDTDFRNSPLPFDATRPGRQATRGTVAASSGLSDGACADGPGEQAPIDISLELTVNDDLIAGTLGFPNTSEVATFTATLVTGGAPTTEEASPGEEDVPTIVDSIVNGVDLPRETVGAVLRLAGCENLINVPQHCLPATRAGVELSNALGPLSVDPAVVHQLASAAALGALEDEAGNPVLPALRRLFPVLLRMAAHANGSGADAADFRLAIGRLIGLVVEQTLRAANG
jgi:hypothetical protein